MSENLPRRLRNKRRTGTGRATTERAHINSSIQRGKRSGLEINFQTISKVDGFQLPGSFFDTIKIPSKYKSSSEEESSDSTSSQEEEEEGKKKIFFKFFCCRNSSPQNRKSKKNTIK